MKELDSMYDIIFQDEELRKLFLNFHSKNWKILSIDEKFEVFVKINDRVASLYGYKAPLLKKAGEKSRNSGTQDSYRWVITINPLMMENGYESADTFFHELRHAFQRRAIESKLTDKEYANPEDVKKWLHNSFIGDTFQEFNDLYYFQPIEKDAWITGLLTARKIYLLNKEYISEPDPTWQEYCKLHKDVIVKLISENSESKEALIRAEALMEKKHPIEEKDVVRMDKGLQHINTILKNKTFDELDIKEVGALLSPYAFCFLNIDQKVAILKRYYALTRINKRSITIEASTIGAIKIGRRVLPSTSGYMLANEILTLDFRNIVKSLVNGEDVGVKFSKKAQAEIKLNMYKDSEGKRINFVKEQENLFMFSLQPYAKYETYYILKELYRLKEIEAKAYGGNKESIWHFWKNFYDNRLIFNTASDVMGIPFNEYYKNLLDQYRKNILEDKKKSNKR